MDQQFQNVQDAVEVIVGRTYLVNTVRTLTCSTFSGEPMPILGQMHEDRETIKFPYEHFHIDWRFVTQAMYEHVQTIILQQLALRDELKRFWNLMAIPLSVGFAIQSGPAIKRVPLKCKRPFLVWSDKPEWMPDLERAYFGKRACKDICPHRGISLVGAPEDPTIPGSRVCPGHGLCFDKETGVLRPRALMREEAKRFLGNAAGATDAAAWSGE